MRIALLSVVLAAASAVPVTAQNVPNLSGTWVMQADKSNFGPMPGPSSRTDVIDHQEPRLTIKRTAVGQSGEVTVDLTFAVDGKPHKNTVGTTELTSTLRWEGQTLVMVSIAPTPQGEATLTDRWTLSDGGKTLTQVRTIDVQGQSFEQTAVFAKQ